MLLTKFTFGRFGVEAKARARLTAVVDLPTPPFPLATTTTLPTPSITFLLGRPLFINASCLFFSCSSFQPPLVNPRCSCLSVRPNRHCCWCLWSRNTGRNISRLLSRFLLIFSARVVDSLADLPGLLLPQGTAVDQPLNHLLAALLLEVVPLQAHLHKCTSNYETSLLSNQDKPGAGKPASDKDPPYQSSASHLPITIGFLIVHQSWGEPSTSAALSLLSCH